MPRLSIVIPTYNRGQYILESLQSIWDQGFQDYEILVVDNGSTDNTQEILQPLIENMKVKLLHQAKSGAAAARNMGVQNATGELIAFLDSDDIFYPTKLQKQITCFDQNPDDVIVHANFRKFDDLGNNLGERNTSFFSGWIYPQILLYWEMLIAISSVMLKTEVFEKVGLFNEELDFGEDLEFWARIAQKHSFRHLPECLVGIRVHPGNISHIRARTADIHLPYLKSMIKYNPGLSKSFKQKMISTSLLFSGLNMLFEGSQEDMKIARKIFLRILQTRPFEIRAWVGLIVTFLNITLRKSLGTAWRRSRYKRLQTK